MSNGTDFHRGESYVQASGYKYVHSATGSLIGAGGKQRQLECARRISRPAKHWSSIGRTKCSIGEQSRMVEEIRPWIRAI